MLGFFFFNDTATTEIYTLSLHDSLPICRRNDGDIVQPRTAKKRRPRRDSDSRRERGGMDEVIPTDYEDYNPIVRLEDEKDEPPEVKLDDE